MADMSFIPIKNVYRILFGILTITVFYFSLINLELSLNLTNSLAIFFFSLKLLLFVTPLLFFKTNYFLHPLVFIPLWGLLTTVYPESGIIMRGLENYPGFAGYSQPEVQQIVTIKFFMDCVFMFFIYVGFFLFNSNRILHLKHRDATNVPLKLFVMLLFTLFIVYLMVDQIGSLFLLAMTKGKYVAQQIGGHLNFLSGFLTIAVWFAAAMMKNPFKSFIFIVSFILAMMVEFLVTASRGSVFAIIVITTIILISKRGEFNLKKLFILGLALVLLVGTLTSLRHTIQSKNSAFFESSVISLPIMAIHELTSYAGSGNSDFAMYKNIIDSSEHLYGESYLAILAAPIPRSLWKDKPVGVGSLASRAFMPEYKHKTGVPPSPAGEAYWNFGLAGVMGVAIFFGILLRYIWQFIQRNNYPGFMVLYIITLYYLKPQTSLVKLSLFVKTDLS